MQWLSFCTLTLIQVVYYYPVDESSLAALKKKKGEKTTANYLLFKKGDTLLGCYSIYLSFTCFWTDIASVCKWNFIMFPNMVHFVGMPVMCSDMLQNSMHEASKHVTGILLFKGYVVEFENQTAVLLFGSRHGVGISLSSSVAFSCWLSSEQQLYGACVCFLRRGFPVGYMTVRKHVYS